MALQAGYKAKDRNREDSMGPRATPPRVANCLEQVRARLLTGLHLGRFKPGDRAPSIRRMAALTHFNPKTVQRAYRQLTADGLLDAKWGSGTFFCDSRSKPSPASRNSWSVSSELTASRNEPQTVGTSCSSSGGRS